MGVWGPGLYSGDMAEDLRLTTKAVVRLPFDSGRLVKILCGLVPDAANNLAHEDHTIFWLVVADQFAKYGIDSDKVRRKALQIIEDGTDINTMGELGMVKADLKRRQKHLDKLKECLLSPITETTSRELLKEPEPYTIDIGDLFIYPTDKGHCINPYMSPREVQENWKHNSWSAAAFIDRGRALDYLSWYRAITIVDALEEKPSFEKLRSVRWVLRNPGTLSTSQLKKMELTKIERVQISETKIHKVFPVSSSGFFEAMSNISIANHLSVQPGWQLLGIVSSMPPKLIKLNEIISGDTFGSLHRFFGRK